MYAHADSLPEIATKKQRENWIGNQTELIRLLTEMGIPPEKFDWRFRKIRLRLKDGSFRPAIRAKGYCTVLCVLKPLLAKDSESLANYQLFEPDETDTSYFGIY
ncbi:MAG: C1 family peptidase [Bacteroidales bacterium]|nr:C1 family peptidase [Bacteroidales bacterium]MCF6341700.1 C1 family peptidase [Bacteroidales bacterium]